VYRKTSCGRSTTAGVLFLHGGPHSAVTDAWTAPLLALVSEGYTVILPNYRGSSGYGEAHLSALPGNAGKVCICICSSSTLLDSASTAAAFFPASLPNSAHCQSHHAKRQSKLHAFGVVQTFCWRLMWLQSSSPAESACSCAAQCCTVCIICAAQCCITCICAWAAPQSSPACPFAQCQTGAAPVECAPQAQPYVRRVP
jgi:hypothetical protein